MVLTQRDRGPDGVGVFSDGRVGLGCARLEIVGSPLEGAQPIRDPWGGVLVFNGEIYEHEEILRELDVDVPEGTSDGFALSALLATRGPEGLSGVRAMFAAARYDPARGRLLLVRDAIGKKPLYIQRFREGWAFASTLASLSVATGALSLRPEAVHEYLVFRSVGGYHSAFKDVEQLPPGSWLELSLDGHARSGRWWRPPPACTRVATAAEIRGVVEEAVAARLESDREIAVFLSGGLDSAIVARCALRQRPGRPVHLLSVGYDVAGDEDERAKARALADYFGASLEELTVSAAEVPDLLGAVARATEDPIQDPVTVPTLVLARAARARAKIVLTGDGSDEVWGGYARFDDVPRTLDEYLPRTTIFRPSEVGLAELPASYLDSIELPSAELPPLDRVMRLEVQNRLRNYHLSRLDKITMSVALEARCPFLDVGVVTVGLELASHDKRPAGRPKGLLSSAFAGELPRWLIDRAKQPFSVPILAWLAGPLHEFAHDVLLAPGAFTGDFVDAGALLGDLDKRTPGAAQRAAKVWSLLQLEVWHRTVASERTRPVG
jgi:asparagine synthase (glutamine-hydrolysing)